MQDLAKDEGSPIRVWGFPINSTLTTMEALWKKVELTKVHMVNRHDVEFGISVVIDSQPANILSVWIYVCAFVDKSLQELGLN